MELARRHSSCCKCHIILASRCCWYHQTLIYIEKEHKCVSVPRLNTVSNKFFFVLHNLHTDIHDKKHSVAQYKGGWVWHGIDFFVFWSTDWQHSGTASMCHHKLVSLSKLFSCLRRLCRFSPQLEQLPGKKITPNKMLRRKKRKCNRRSGTSFCKNAECKCIASWLTINRSRSNSMQTYLIKHNNNLP